MKRMNVLLSVLLVSAALVRADAPPVAPEPKTLIDKTVAAMGDPETLANLKSLSLKGNLAIPAQQINGTIVLLQKGENLLVRMEIPGLGTIQQGLHGDIGYEQSDLTGTRLLSDDEKKQLVGGLSPDHQADQLKELKEMTVTGPVQVGQKQAWQLTGQSENGEESYLIDTTSFLTLQMKTTIKTQMGAVPTTILFSDHKQVDGLWIPMTLSQTVGPAEMQLKFTEVKVNPDLPDAELALPAEVKKLVDNAAATTQPATQPQ